MRMCRPGSTSFEYFFLTCTPDKIYRDLHRFLVLKHSFPRNKTSIFMKYIDIFYFKVHFISQNFNACISYMIILSPNKILIFHNNEHFNLE